MDPAKPRPTPRLFEVGPRDGLQTEKDAVPLDAKVAYIDALSETGLKEIEAGAFVNPKAIPQLANSEQVFARIKRKPGVLYSALAANAAGLDLALAVKVDKISVLIAATESSNQKYARSGIRGSFELLRPVVARARREPHVLARPRGQLLQRRGPVHPPREQPLVLVQAHRGAGARIRHVEVALPGLLDGRRRNFEIAPQPGCLHASPLS